MTVDRGEPLGIRGQPTSDWGQEVESHLSDERAGHVSGLVEVGTDLGAVLGQVVTAIHSMTGPSPTMPCWLCVWF